MGSLNLVCPMCCGETFNNPQSLKYHLLSITDNLYCPGCSQRSDSVTALIQHLDKCQQGLQRKIKPEILMDKARKVYKESENRANILADVKVQQINRSFLATMNDTGIVIVGDPQTIQVNENGEIKVIEKLDLDETQQEQNSLDFKMSDGLCGIGGEKQKRPQSSQELVAIPVSSCVAERKEVSLDKSMIAVLSENSELLNGDVTTFIDVDRINDVGELDEAGLLRVKQELCEMESDAVYSCTSCDISFNSVLEHIKQFHDGQEVLLEMAEQFDDLTTIPVSSMSTVPESSENIVNTRQRQTMNTLRTEECIDSEGRLYTRKVVQIERFWDRTPIQVATSQSAKAPMIEKFFSNVEGIKVREKRLAAAPLRMYKCNQCSQQFSKLGNFRVHACLHGNKRCEHCDQSFATSKALQLHMKVHENQADPSQKTFICTACGTEFCSHKSLRLHSRMHAPVRARHVDAPEGTPTVTFTCPECGKTLSESYKNAHMALHTGDSVTCAVCNRKFDSSDSLAMHAAVHTELAPPQSPTSSVLITTSATGETATITATTLATTTTETITVTTATATLTSNTTATVTVQASESQKPYQCQHCGRRFTRPHEKVKHERIHTGEKPHACEVCGKTFRVSYCLTLHMRTHTGVRPYTCQHCGKRFKASSVYNHHMLTHGDARAYTCPYCPKTFKTRVQLAGHKNSHTKPFRCTECSRPFASLYAARSHIQTHKKDNNLKYSCYICGASYGRAFALKDHLKQHGQNVLAPPEPAREEEVHEGFLLGEEVSNGDKCIRGRLGILSSTLPVGPMGNMDTD